MTRSRGKGQARSKGLAGDRVGGRVASRAFLLCMGGKASPARESKGASMAIADEIRWFKQQFGTQIEVAVAGTPFTLDFLSALAFQETGELWSAFRKAKPALPITRLLELCVGDTIDAKGSKGRRAFPRNRAELEAYPQGNAMFAIGRQGLVDMARYCPQYQPMVANPDKFCRGYGIFQYDLQFFKENPDYFLQKKYSDFGVCLERSLRELRGKLKRLGWEGRSSLNDSEMAAVAIAYNTGNYKPSLGLQQGHQSGGKFYGENFFDYLRIAKTVAGPAAAAPALPTPAPGAAIVAPPTPVTASGKVYEVDVISDPLMLRSTPEKTPKGAKTNIVKPLPDGHRVTAISRNKVNGYLEVETSIQGALFRGWASAEYLKPVAEPAPAVAAPLAAPAPTTPPQGSMPAAYKPNPQGSTTRRVDLAGARSLNEAGQPQRKGGSPAELRAELATIIEWLSVDRKAHRRYLSREGLTFCNIYAHDYCHLAGVYLPRVWWTGNSIEAIAQGKAVDAKLENTVREMRANALFDWLQDFGPRFGWRQTGTLTKLQNEVNQGAIGLIVAKRVDTEKPGHIVAVVPETPAFSATRNATGDVTKPLQSQAGVQNFRYSTGTLEWWKNPKFADFAFWIHA